MEREILSLIHFRRDQASGLRYVSHTIPDPNDSSSSSRVMRTVTVEGSDWGILRTCGCDGLVERCGWSMRIVPSRLGDSRRVNVAEIGSSS